MGTIAKVAKAVRVVRSDGVAGLLARTVGADGRLTAALAPGLPLLAGDVVHSSEVVAPPDPPARAPGSSLTVGWVISPPSAGSGGHTTLFRFVRALEQAGHRCVLFVYDSRNDDVRPYEATVRAWWPEVRAEVRSARAGLLPMDALVATSWLTAHVLAGSRAPGRRFYLVQDYEPHFYAHGAEHELAEDTYRFGFRHVTVGPMLAVELEKRFGVESVVADFGADLQAYRVTDPGPRRGVAFFSRPGVARRGHELGVMALQEFHRQRPDVPIHVFGSVARPRFPAQVHGKVRPAELNALYNRCSAALALSFTNVSLVPHEMLAAGVVPVCNDFEGARTTLTSPAVVWARATPTALARALVEVVDSADGTTAERAAATVRGTSWEPACRCVVDMIERTCAG
ncbi:rhamnosyltransferase WsaF family glycosyltransferase [Geodermatophilus sp. SYSU D01119]